MRGAYLPPKAGRLYAWLCVLLFKACTADLLIVADFHPLFLSTQTRTVLSLSGANCLLLSAIARNTSYAYEGFFLALRWPMTFFRQSPSTVFYFRPSPGELLMLRRFLFGLTLARYIFGGIPFNRFLFPAIARKASYAYACYFSALR